MKHTHRSAPSKSGIGNTFVGGPLSSKNKEYTERKLQHPDAYDVSLVGNSAKLFEGNGGGIIRFIPGAELTTLTKEAVIEHHKTGKTPKQLAEIVNDLIAELTSLKGSITGSALRDYFPAKEDICFHDKTILAIGKLAESNAELLEALKGLIEYVREGDITTHTKQYLNAAEVLNKASIIK